MNPKAEKVLNRILEFSHEFMEHIVNCKDCRKLYDGICDHISERQKNGDVN